MFTPHRAHFDLPTASIIFRKNLNVYNLHERESKNLYQSLPKDQKLSVGDRVRLKYQKAIISKESQIFNPRLSNEIYTIKEVLREKFPYFYTLNELKTRKFYAFQLYKSNNLLTKLRTQRKPSHIATTPTKQTILVKSATEKTSKTTRTGRSYGRAIVYEIVKNNKTEYVDRDALLLYKKLFSNILEYDDSFHSNSKLNKLIV